ncbi:MAG: hypothetical protein UV71_C0001G0046 [Microgenomates group bacterium GW2011_GWC1_43_13]|uniref:Uncharacterized protein n=3 Tax=Candidatus Woeseibacteriota TaxID=1752722 RepID=A0A837IE68_9BACT|nr:MAG: hypothetical protein UV71_C0001G0046 [Microgenomates group bacterium GW2011_GWC1_43_13]KKT33495.1 MAG: hypothetical protein UW20_C0001G0006 [Candidatus Woesebacteria bacterium GW2011_GWB1_44_11]KKT54984.1 MAG: hypothetical protein UW47_C0001G0006 [Candidatus Woesebacteria bacterium GW2011_GWA1_44_23]OGM76710.1 MAG: hypothetical protein A2208_00370 [Candidatus Woesebacteria bacterium RIFOXYA1_FULL_43_16]OGM83311.1 MAG: hypothetical protein A2394_01495 [Candidatus Woesebacteria bacterium 
MKKTKLPSLITILILTLITGVLWVSLSTYRAFTAKPSESVPEEISNPIDPTLDQATIKKIESGIYFDSSQIPENLVTAPIPTTPAQPAQSPLPTPTLEATPTPVPSPTP